jgi:hypothetical protein
MATLVIRGKNAVIAQGSKVTHLNFVERPDKNTKFNKFAVKNGKAIVTVYATPDKNYEVVLEELKDCENGHRFAFESKGLIAKVYLAKQGKTMKVH